MASNDPLLQPYQLKHLTLKNRIMTTSHEPAYPEDGMPKARYRAYHQERAKAGVAMVMTAGSATVAKDSPPVFNNILAYKDEVVPYLKDVVDACHEHDCAVMIQLTHLGRRTGWAKGDWLPAVSASHHREASHRAFPKQVENWDIERIIRDYADAAERMYAAGMDGIELQAYGHLMDQFWSPLTNTLEGPYGGSLHNRLRFTMEVLDAIRARVGSEFIVGVRYTADEAFKGGLTPDEGLEISKILRDSGQVDFLNVIRGRIDTDPALTDVIPVMGMQNSPHLDFAGAIREATGFPTFHAAKIPDVATARHAIAEGKLDMVGMTRAHMADPHIVRKIMAGREDDIRPCIGANYCLDRIYQAGDAFCMHNAATGRELSMPHDIPPAEVRKRIVIVGAGPGGLEAARVAAERGHEVIVLEAASEPGGQVRLTAQTPRRHEMMSIIDWRMAQCMARDVDLRFNTWAEAVDVQALDPDVVIIATGGMPHTDVLSQGNDLVVSSWDILSGDVKPGNNVLIFDDAGDHPALQAAEVIANSGAKLEIMTPDRSFSPDIMAMNLVPYMRSLQDQDVTFTVTYRADKAEKVDGQIKVSLSSDYGSIGKHRMVDQLVINHGTLPLDDIYFELRDASSNGGELDQDAFINGKPQTVVRNAEGKYQLFRIGDAVAARNTHAAIFDALRLVKDI
ncbi:MAG TPA: N-methylproline demethylase [Oceanospirillaceae bacterium]|nr:N-methylproline demethylase [Oceanospirillaceae bacterium]